MDSLEMMLESIPAENRHRLDETLRDCSSRARIAKSLGTNWKVVAHFLSNLDGIDIDSVDYDNRSLEQQQ